MQRISAELIDQIYVLIAALYFSGQVLFLNESTLLQIIFYKALSLQPDYTLQAFGIILRDISKTPEL